MREIECTRWIIVGKLSDSCHQHALHQVDTYVWGWCNVTLTCYCDSRRFSRGLGWWSDVCNLKNVCLLCAVAVFWSGFNCLLFLHVDCECNRPSCLATVFSNACAFNGDLNQWNVATVTAMSTSKSVRILENDLTWRELEGSVEGLLKMV
jgi:hypothetical protein